MKQCNISLEQRGNIDVIELDGSLDAYSFPRLESTIENLQKNDQHQVILDCGKLEYIGSAALGTLVAFTRRIREHGGDMILVHLSDKILNIVNLLGFDKILTIHPDVSTAAEAFTGG